MGRRKRRWLSSPPCAGEDKGQGAERRTLKISVGRLEFEFLLYFSCSTGKIIPVEYDMQKTFRVGLVIFIPPDVVEWQLRRYSSGGYGADPWEPEGVIDFLETKMANRIFAGLKT